jgi:hypothetical protein
VALADVLGVAAEDIQLRDRPEEARGGMTILMVIVGLIKQAMGWQKAV